MEIQKQGEEKWIRPAYGMYLTQSAAVETKDRLLVKQVCVTAESSADEWREIDAEEAKAVQKAKDMANGNADYPETEVNQALALMATRINSMGLTDEQSLQYKNLYPKWETFINQKLDKDFKILYEDRLYKVRQTIEKVLENQPPSIGTASLYEEINDKNEGTREDPIPYNNNMELFAGKYYSQNGVVYRCARDTEQAVYQDLSGLVGIYVEVVTE